MLKNYFDKLISQYEPKWSYSFFWRWLLFLHAPYLLILGITNILRSEITTRNIILQIALWVSYFFISVFLGGHFIRRLSIIYCGNPISVSLFKIGTKLVLFLLIFRIIYIIPGYIFNFATSFIASFFLGLLGNKDNLDYVSFSSGFVVSFQYVFSFYIFGAISRTLALELMAIKKGD